MAMGRLEHEWDTTNVVWTTFFNEIEMLRSDQRAMNGGRRRPFKPIQWQTLNPFRS